MQIRISVDILAQAASLAGSEPASQPSALRSSSSDASCGETSSIRSRVEA